MTIMLARRSFLATIAGALVCAPAVVRAASIMPVRVPLIVRSSPVLAPAVMSRAWQVAGIDYSQKNIFGNDTTRMSGTLRLVETFFADTPQGPIVLDHDNIFSWNVRCFPEMVHSWTLQGPPVCVENRPAEVELVVDLKTALSTQLGDLVEFEDDDYRFDPTRVRGRET